jgi:hypothetical protein
MDGCVTDLDDLRESVRRLPLDREVLLMPINDNCDVGRPGGGTHWTLLMYDSRRPAAARFTHLDPSPGGSGSNLVAARETAAALMLILPMSEPVASAGPHVYEHPCALQSNGSDCGIFVLAFCERIATEMSLARISEPVDAGNYRKRIASAIQFLAQGASHSP